MIDINLEQHQTNKEKISLNSKNVSFTINNSFTSIKCFQSLPTILNLECKELNIIKIHKTIFLNLPNLIHIDLNQNKLIKISKNFKFFKNLETLKLDSNQITFIPSFISEFTKLKTFTISNNNLTSIPASIQYLKELKTFKFSNNKIEKIPIEFGQLKNLECLYLDGNYFTEIPTTFCYLKRLNELCFEWNDFVEPPLYKLLKDSMGFHFIEIIRKSLQEMIKNSILYCDFQTYLLKISENINKTNELNNNNNNVNNSKDLQTLQNSTNRHLNINANQTQNKYYKIFSAIDSNYFGVVKSLLSSVDYENYLKIKNIENKTPFYIAISKKTMI